MPFVQSFVYGSNIDCNQSKPIWSFVQPLSLTAIIQSNGRSAFINQFIQCVFPAKIIIGGNTQPDTLIVSIAVTHSQLPGCMRLGHDYLLVWVITFVVATIPIAKPVSSKLQISSSIIPHSSIVFHTSLNHSCILLGFSQRAH